MKRNPFLALLATLIALGFSPAPAQAAPATSVEVLTTIGTQRTTSHSITTAEGINNSGITAGDFHMRGTVLGYTRLQNGKLSKPFQASTTADTFVQGINTSGLIVGYTQDPITFHGYFFQNGVVTPYDVPGSSFTVLYGVNDAGDFTGRYVVTGGSSNGFGFASIGGVFTNIVIGDADFVSPHGINNSEAVVGWYALPGDGDVHGFLWRPDGSAVYPVDFPGAPVTNLAGVNDHGTIVGSWTDSSLNFHGFVVQGLTRFTQFDIPGAVSTYVTGINNANVITGYYRTDTFEIFGFLARLQK